TLGEPFAHRRGQPLGVNAQSGFDLPLAGRQGVVKFRRSGEIPHTEAVKPIERSGPALCSDYDFHLQFPGVHLIEIVTSCMCRRTCPGRPWLSPYSSRRNLEFSVVTAPCYTIPK